MRKIFLGILTALIAITGVYGIAHAAILGAPYLPEIDKRFDAIEMGRVYKQGLYPAGSNDGPYAQQQIQVTYDFAKQTGAVGTYDLGVSLPKNAIISNSGIYSITKPTTSASGTLAFYCQNQFNILNPTAAASFGAAGAAIAGTQNGTVTNWSTVTAACDVMAKITTGALTAGKVTLYIEYYVHQ
jgi:hypothetical protein